MKKEIILLMFCFFLAIMSAGCTYTTRNFDSAGHKSISETDDLQLVDSYFTTSLGVNSAIVGHIKNNSDRTFHNVKVKIKLWFGGSVIGYQMATVSEIEPGDTWAFRTSSTGGTEYADAYKVIEISGS
jgi:uncharacterized membrane protein SpoIIM required for sporulation